MTTLHLTLRVFALCFLTGSFTLCSSQSALSATNDSAQPSAHPATEVALDRPDQLVILGSDILYASSLNSTHLYRLDLKTGLMSALRTQASIDTTTSMQEDQDGNLIAAISAQCRMVRIGVDDGSVHTIVGGRGEGTASGGCGSGGDGGPALKAVIDPEFFTQDKSGNLFIEGGFYKPRIRRVDKKSGIITTLVDPSRLKKPSTITSNSQGLSYIAQVNGRPLSRAILSLDPVTGSLTALKPSSFIGTKDLWTESTWRRRIFSDRLGNLYVMDESRIFFLDMSTHVVSLVAGTTKGFSGDGGPATKAQLYWPTSLVLDSVGNIYVADSENQRIRRIDAKTHIITTVAGNGKPTHTPGTVQIGE